MNTAADRNHAGPAHESVSRPLEECTGTARPGGNVADCFANNSRGAYYRTTKIRYLCTLS